MERLLAWVLDKVGLDELVAWHAAACELCSILNSLGCACLAVLVDVEVKVGLVDVAELVIDVDVGLVTDESG